MKKLSDTKLRILVLLCSSVFILANLSKSALNYVISSIDNLDNSRNSRITLNYNTLGESDLSRLHE